MLMKFSNEYPVFNRCINVSYSMPYILNDLQMYEIIILICMFIK